MVATRDFYNNYDELDSVSVEEPLCNYLTAFDGTKKDFDDIRPYFDDLFSDNLIHLMDGRPVGKSTFSSIIKNLIDQRFVATLEDLFFVDDTHIEYTVHWGNEHTSMVTHILAVVADGKIMKMQPCEETKGAFAGMGYHGHSNLNPWHQSMGFRGRLKWKNDPPSFERPLPYENTSVVRQLTSANLYVSPQKYLSKIGDLVGKAVGSHEGGSDERSVGDETANSIDLDGEREKACSSPPNPSFSSSVEET